MAKKCCPSCQRLTPNGDILCIFVRKINVSDIFIVKIVKMCQNGFKSEGLKCIEFEIPTIQLENYEN